MFILIPAHNESAVIAQTVAAVKGCLTESDRLIVIDDGSTDDTAALAERAGAEVVRRLPAESMGGRPTKGGALRWWAAFGCELKATDGVIVLDADSVIEPNFIQLMRAQLQSGRQAAQGFIQPVGVQSPVAAAAAFSTLLEQRIDDRLRARLGWPVRLRGTGFMLRADVFADVIAHVRTEVEDVELSLLLAQRGINVAFVPEAIVLDRLPATAVMAAQQRARWLRGQGAVGRLYWREIGLLLGRGPWAWSLLSSLLLKPRSLMIALKIALAVGTGLLAALWSPFIWLSALAALGVAFDGLYILIGWWLVATPNRWSRRSWIEFLLMWLRSLSLALTQPRGWRRAR